jgi:hypothetical protein
LQDKWNEVDLITKREAEEAYIKEVDPARESFVMTMCTTSCDHIRKIMGSTTDESWVKLI